MFSATAIYGLGLLVSLVNILLWVVILRSQFQQFSRNRMNERIKIALLVFGVLSLFSNITPIWFDVYQITRQAHPTNITIAYIISQYLYRTVTASMFYIIYREG